MARHQETFDEKRNLIVNYLPSSLTQDDVKQLFNGIGPVSNCKLVRSYETGQSLGYAFIEYPSEQMASEAIKRLDGTTMEEKTLKVSYARQSSPEIKNSNVYVAGLPDNITEDALYSLFEPFGKIITHKLLINPDNSSRGVGFVRYSLKSEAQLAIESMGGKMLPGGRTALTVKLAIPPVSKQQNHLMASSSQINAMAGVSGISAMRGSVRFNPLAPSNQAITNPVPVLSALPTIESPLASNSALIHMRSEPVIANAATPTATAQVFSIYVFGLQVHHSELHLYELFAPFGAILNVKLIRDLKKEDKPSKGYGFVNFKKYADAYTAVATMNNRLLEGKPLQVSFKQNKGHETALLGTSPAHGAITHIQQHIQPEVDLPSQANLYMKFGS